MIFLFLLLHVSAQATLPPDCMGKLSKQELVRKAQLRPEVSWQWLLEPDVAERKIPLAQKGKGSVVYDIDLFHSSLAQIQSLKAKDKVVICYFAAGSLQLSTEVNSKDCLLSAGHKARNYANQKMKQHFDLLPDEAIMGRMRDWKDNCWLDIRSPHVFQLVKSFLSVAHEKGCDGVEFDNMDAGLDSDNREQAGFPGKESEIIAAQLAFNRAIAAEANRQCLFAGVKNGHSFAAVQCPHFDFAVTESIVAESKEKEAEGARVALENWKKCAAAGKPIFAAEYQNLGGNCDLVPKGLSVNLFKNNRFVDGGQSCNSAVENAGQSAADILKGMGKTKVKCNSCQETD